MPITESEMDSMINEVFDDTIADNEMPYICGMLKTTIGRKRLFDLVKKMILEQGETDIDAMLAQWEEARNFRY